MRKERPGFIVNRLMGALEREIDYLLDEGIVTPEDLDVAVKSSTGFRFACLGPMEVEDMIGLDVSMIVSGRVFKGSEQRHRAVAHAGGEGQQRRAGDQVGQGLVRLQRQDALSRSSRRRTASCCRS